MALILNKVAPPGGARGELTAPFANLPSLTSPAANTPLTPRLLVVRRGKRVVVTDRGQPIAELVPYVADQSDLAGRIAAMAEEPWLTAAPVREREEVGVIELRTETLASELVSRMRDER